jgi:hypothetical protein
MTILMLEHSDFHDSISTTEVEYEFEFEFDIACWRPGVGMRRAS